MDVLFFAAVRGCFNSIWFCRETAQTAEVKKYLIRPSLRPT